MDRITKLGLAGLLLLFAGCRESAGTAVVVTVTGQVPAFDHLAITLTAGGTTRTPTPIAQSSIPPDIVFGIDVPRAVKGPLHVAVDAVDAAGTTLFSAADDVTLSPGKLKTLTLTLGDTTNKDGGPADDLTVVNPGNDDLSTADLTAPFFPDLGPTIPAVVTLSGTRPLPVAPLANRKFVDLNGDGKLDILDWSTTSFNVTLNRGDGVFAAPVSHTGNSLQTPVDLNGDGLLDFIGFNGTTITVYLNSGTGIYPLTGATAASSTASGNVNTIQVSDLNKEGHPDLLCFMASVAGTITLDVFLNNNAGVFPAAPSSSFTVPNTTTLVALTDLTGDSAPDLFITTASTDWHTYLNDGMGGFGPQSSPQPAFNSLPNSGLIFKDVSGDGKVDVVLANSTNLDVIPGKADGTFGTLSTFPAGVTFTEFKLVDLNGDNVPDVVLRNSSSVIEVMLNNGTGGYGAATTLTTGAGSASFQVVDLNGDNRPEVISLDAGGTIDVFMNDTHGVFAARVPYAIDPTSSAMVLADVNNDLRPDILSPRPTGFSVLLNSGTGTFGARADTTGPSTTQFADLTGDGRLDAFGGTGSTVWYSLNNGSGVFGTAVSAALVNLFTASNLNSVDLNGDGVADITGSDSYITTTSGAPDFPIAVATTGTPISVVIGDFKTDGHPDVVTTFGGTVISAFINNGDATFGGQQDYTAGTTTVKLAAGHVKTPTSLDVVVSNSGTTNVSLLTGKGDGTFDPKVDYPINSAPGAVALADLNNDMHDDLVVALAGTVGVLLNNGSGIFSPENDYAGIGSIRLLLADLNDDKHPDLVTVSGPTVSSLINNGAGAFAGKNDYTWSAATVSNSRLIDLTGDGELDLVTSITPPTGGMLNLRANNGNGTFAMPTDLVAGTLFAFGDLNRDGRQDLVVGFGNTVRVLIQNASGTFVAGGEYDVPSPAFLEIADFDGDGLGDVLVGGGGVTTHLYVLKNISK